MDEADETIGFKGITNDFLLHIGNAESNSVTNIVESDIDEYQPYIISDTPYYDFSTNLSTNI